MSSKHCNYLPWVFVRPPAALTCVSFILWHHFCRRLCAPNLENILPPSSHLDPPMDNLVMHGWTTKSRGWEDVFEVRCTPSSPKMMSQYKALAQVPSHINTHLTNVIDENVQSSSKFVHNSVVVGTWMAKQPFFGSKQWIIFSFSCFLYALHGVVRRRWTYIVVGVRHKNML